MSKRISPDTMWLVAMTLVSGCSSYSSPRSALLAEAYRDIDARYVDPIPTSDLAEAAVFALQAMDHDLAIEVNSGRVAIKRDGHVLRAVSRPAPVDWRGWGEATAQLADAAASASPTISRLSAEDLDTALMKSVVAMLDRHSRYVPPTAPEKASSELRGAGAKSDPPRRPSHAGYAVAVETPREAEHILILRIDRFSTSTEREVRRKLSEARRMAKPISGVILDLRDNPGGELIAAFDLVDLFLGHGVIASFEARSSAGRHVVDAKLDAKGDEHVPLAVLINGGSASASEIVAAALQDNRRALILGTPSYGKGTAQTGFELINGGELWVTSAYARAPSGYLLEHHGVLPDICTTEADPRRARKWVLDVSATPRMALSESQWTNMRRQCSGAGTERAEPDDVTQAMRILARANADGPSGNPR